MQLHLQQIWQRDRFDYLINNAGISHKALFTETTEAEFDELMNTHFKGPFFLTQCLLPLLNDCGRILNVSTGLARFTLLGSGTYAAMKGVIEIDALLGERTGRARDCH